MGTEVLAAIAQSGVAIDHVVIRNCIPAHLAEIDQALARITAELGVPLAAQRCHTNEHAAYRLTQLPTTGLTLNHAIFVFGGLHRCNPLVGFHVSCWNRGPTFTRDLIEGQDDHRWSSR